MERTNFEGKSEVCKKFSDLMSLTDSLIMCRFTSFVITGAGYAGVFLYPQIGEILGAVTGRERSLEEMLEIGERNYVLLKLLASREGFTKKDDKLPDRFQEKLSKGGSRGEKITKEELQEKIDEYYKIRGFDQFGPTDEKLEQLDLSELKGLIKRH